MTRGGPGNQRGKPGVQAYPTDCATRAPVVPSPPRRCVGAARESPTFEPTTSPTYRLEHAWVLLRMCAYGYSAWYVYVGIVARAVYVRARGMFGRRSRSREMTISEWGDRHLRDRDLRQGYRTSSTREHMWCSHMSHADQHMRC